MTTQPTPGRGEDSREVLPIGFASLSVADVVAVARGGARLELERDPAYRARLEAGRRALESALRKGVAVYGVTTALLRGGAARGRARGARPRRGGGGRGGARARRARAARARAEGEPRADERHQRDDRARVSRRRARGAARALGVHAHRDDGAR